MRSLERNLERLPAGLVVPTRVEGVRDVELENLIHELSHLVAFETCPRFIDDMGKFPTPLSSHITFLIATEAGHHVHQTAGYWARHLEIRALACGLRVLRGLGLVADESVYLEHVRYQQARMTDIPFLDLPDRVRALVDGPRARADVTAVEQLLERTVEAIYY